MTIVPRLFEDRPKTVRRESQGSPHSKGEMENGGILFESNSRGPSRRSETHVSQKAQKTQK